MNQFIYIYVIIYINIYTHNIYFKLHVAGRERIKFRHKTVPT